MGLAIYSWYSAVYETKDGKQECPKGFALDNTEIWLASLTTEERNRVTKNGTVALAELRGFSAARTPTGVDICYHPTLVKDPPMHTVEGKFSLGFDLDGASGGKAAANTCKHREFVSPDGRTGIDNQWYRLIGCTLGWRDSGYMELEANGELRDGHRAILIEINGIEDLTNSPDVEVVFYQATDALVKEAGGKATILANSSFRIADSYRHVARGRIVKNVLTTDPIDIHFPFFGNLVYADMYIRGMRLNIELAEDKAAKGMLGGYYDIESFWGYLSKVGYTHPAAHFSCPAFYEAARRLADGYPDPQTGDCTALSAAFKIEAVPAFIIHPKPQARSAAQAQLSTRSVKD